MGRVQFADAPFGASAHGAAHMGLGRCGGAAGEYEVAQRGEGGVELVDAAFESFYLFGVDAAGFAQGGVGGIGGEVRADGEETVLYVEEQVGVVGYMVGQEGAQQSDVGIQFVDGAVGFEAQVLFGYAFSAYERGLAVVAGAGVEVAFFHVVSLGV